MAADIAVTAENLKRRGFTVHNFQTAGEAADWLCAELHGTSIGFGGSVTLEQLGLYDRLSADNEVAWHWFGGDRKAAESTAAHAKVYILSANAIAQSGEIVNIDGNGNRVAAAFYGHERVIFVVGVNKLACDLHAAIDRARNIASPLNARRLGKKTPCALSEPMMCHDCSSPDRICRGLSVLMERMSSIPCMEVLLINEPLGY